MNFFKRLAWRRPDLAGLPIGTAGEEWVSYLYRQKGFKVLARNFAQFGAKQLGELDIVCLSPDKSELVAVEVRSRGDEEFMQIEETVDAKKQERLRRTLYAFLQKFPEYQNCDLRIDVAAVLINPVDNTIESVRITKNAVEGE